MQAGIMKSRYETKLSTYQNWHKRNSAQKRTVSLVRALSWIIWLGFLSMSVHCNNRDPNDDCWPDKRFDEISISFVGTATTSKEYSGSICISLNFCPVIQARETENMVFEKCIPQSPYLHYIEEYLAASQNKGMCDLKITRTGSTCGCEQCTIFFIEALKIAFTIPKLSIRTLEVCSFLCVCVSAFCTNCHFTLPQIGSLVQNKMLKVTNLKVCEINENVLQVLTAVVKVQDKDALSGIASTSEVRIEKIPLIDFQVCFLCVRWRIGSLYLNNIGRISIKEQDVLGAYGVSTAPLCATLTANHIFISGEETVVEMRSVISTSSPSSTTRLASFAPRICGKHSKTLDEKYHIFVDIKTLEVDLTEGSTKNTSFSDVAAAVHVAMRGCTRLKHLKLLVTAPTMKKTEQVLSRKDPYKDRAYSGKVYTQAEFLVELVEVVQESVSPLSSSLWIQMAIPDARQGGPWAFDISASLLNNEKGIKKAISHLESCPSPKGKETITTLLEELVGIVSHAQSSGKLDGSSFCAPICNIFTFPMINMQVLSSGVFLHRAWNSVWGGSQVSAVYNDFSKQPYTIALNPKLELTLSVTPTGQWKIPRQNKGWLPGPWKHKIQGSTAEFGYTLLIDAKKNYASVSVQEHMMKYPLATCVQAIRIHIDKAAKDLQEGHKIKELAIENLSTAFSNGNLSEYLCLVALAAFGKACVSMNTLAISGFSFNCKLSSYQAASIEQEVARNTSYMHIQNLSLLNTGIAVLHVLPIMMAVGTPEKKGAICITGETEIQIEMVLSHYVTSGKSSIDITMRDVILKAAALDRINLWHINEVSISSLHTLDCVLDYPSCSNASSDALEPLFLWNALCIQRFVLKGAVLFHTTEEAKKYKKFHYTLQNAFGGPDILRNMGFMCCPNGIGVVATWQVSQTKKEIPIIIKNTLKHALEAGMAVERILVFIKHEDSPNILSFYTFPLRLSLYGRLLEALELPKTIPIEWHLYAQSQQANVQITLPIKTNSLSLRLSRNKSRIYGSIWVSREHIIHCKNIVTSLCEKAFVDLISVRSAFMTSSFVNSYIMNVLTPLCKCCASLCTVTEVSQSFSASPSSMYRVFVECGHLFHKVCLLEMCSSTFVECPRCYSYESYTLSSEATVGIIEQVEVKDMDDINPEWNIICTDPVYFIRPFNIVGEDKEWTFVVMM